MTDMVDPSNAKHTLYCFFKRDNVVDVVSGTAEMVAEYIRDFGEPETCYGLDREYCLFVRLGLRIAPSSMHLDYIQYIWTYAESLVVNLVSKKRTKVGDVYETAYVWNERDTSDGGDKQDPQLGGGGMAAKDGPGGPSDGGTGGDVPSVGAGELVRGDSGEWFGAGDQQRGDQTSDTNRDAAGLQGGEENRGSQHGDVPDGNVPGNRVAEEDEEDKVGYVARIFDVPRELLDRPIPEDTRLRRQLEEDLQRQLADHFGKPTPIGFEYGHKDPYRGGFTSRPIEVTSGEVIFPLEPTSEEVQRRFESLQAGRDTIRSGEDEDVSEEADDTER